MRLTELNPRWVTFNTSWDKEDEGKRWHIGVRFDCPHCKTQKLVVYFDPEIDDGFGWKFHHWDGYKEIQKMLKWTREGETFETLTLKPSINTEWAGHWHGFIENGEVR